MIERPAEIEALVTAYIDALDAELTARNVCSGDHAADCALVNATHRARCDALRAMNAALGNPEPPAVLNHVPGWPSLYPTGVSR